MTRARVEFWHDGEKPSQIIKPQATRRYDHARRADEVGLIMAGMAVLVIAVVVLALYLNNKKYTHQAGSAPKSIAPGIDFYQGNQAFIRKVKEEKSGVMANELPVQGATEDFEISLQAQMASMKEKLEKMRSQKLLEEPPIPAADKGLNPVPISGVRPAEIGRFNSPLEFNRMLPKQIQQAK